MAVVNPKGRANYEPNSWGGPRENPKDGFVSYPAAEHGEKLRIRPESFADHYSQARQFYISQTPVEQEHISDALIFELSKVEKPAIRERVISHLENIDQELAQRVARGLGLKALPAQAKAARPTNTSLPPSPELSILKNGPTSFKDRKLGILVTDGVDATTLTALKSAAANVGADVAIIAPTISGVNASDGSHIAADFKINGGPSVLFDSVAILTSEDGAKRLLTDAPAKDFISDAYAHLKFIAFNDSALPLLNKAGITGADEEGVVKLKSSDDATNFLKICSKLRVWNRHDKVTMSNPVKK